MSELYDSTNDTIHSFTKGRPVKQQILRQGDILLVAVKAAPPIAQRRSEQASALVLGYGEVTGHHHVLESAVWVVAEETTQEDLRQFALGNKEMPVFVVVEEDTQLIHQEHSPLAVSAGVWQVLRQRQYFPGEIQSVRD